MTTPSVIPTIISVWNAVITTVGVIGVSLYGSGFRMRAHCLIDSNNVIRIRLVNWGRLEGEVESMQVVIRNSLLHRVIYNGGETVIVSIVDPPDDRRMKSGAVQSWWTLVDLTDEMVLPSRDLLQRQLVNRTPNLDELYVRIQTASSRCKYRRVQLLENPFYEVPGDLSMNEQGDGGRPLPSSRP